VTSFYCAAILFDLDGVLVDSTRSVERQWRAWARRHELDGDMVMAIGHGVRSREIIKRVAPHLDCELEAQSLEAMEAADQDGVRVMPGAQELVGAIPEGCWCVVTSGTRRLATARLQLAGIPIPKVMVTADDVSRGKPHPEPYLKGAELLGVRPEDCLVIEDAPAGIQAAHAGGMKAIGLTSTYGAVALTEADAVIQQLSQIKVSVEGPRKLRIEML
jgi:sugar-phosphatase